MKRDTGKIGPRTLKQDPGRQTLRLDPGPQTPRQDPGPRTLRQDSRPQILRQDPRHRILRQDPGEISRNLPPGRNLLPVLWIYIGAYRGNCKFVLDYLMQESFSEINLKSVLS